MITKKQRLAFLKDLQAVCKKHNLSLGHEDGHGAFLIHPYGDVYVEWLNAADVEEEEEQIEEISKEEIAELEREAQEQEERLSKERKQREEKYPTIF